MTSKILTGEQRVAAVAGLVTVVFFALLMPATTTLDRRTDRARPLYDDVVAVAQYEWDQIRKAGEPVPLTLEAGGEGVGPGLDESTEHVYVTVDGTGYCIEARNTFGDETGALCFEGRERPTSVLDDRAQPGSS